MLVHAELDINGFLKLINAFNLVDRNLGNHKFLRMGVANAYKNIIGLLIRMDVIGTVL